MRASQKGPAARPCGTCPYRKDVPSGIWSQEEYDKLPLYDGETHEQPMAAFGCHQQDGHLCAGWVGCHDMTQNLSIRLEARFLGDEEYDRILDYESPVPLHASGAEAREHGMRELHNPSPKAKTMVKRLITKIGDNA